MVLIPLKLSMYQHSTFFGADHFKQDKSEQRIHSIAFDRHLVLLIARQLMADFLHILTEKLFL